ncbi:hypothetical protein [Micromonospora zhanjiangensis]|uniref:DUF8175 domain-containing protein n=1 Tax=Micromonospora zhanjiangensis TaxID=1522057 RepID=A0ABV8KTL9_9ACTN
MSRQSDAGVDDERPFWRQRGWQLSAGYLALVLCAGVVAVFGAGSDESTGGAGRTTPGQLTVEVGATNSRPAGCRTDDADQSTPVRPPVDVTWRQLNGAGVPSSASAGPLRSTGPLQWCFAHTPMGAVMAANVIPRHMSGAEWRAVTEQQVVPGSGRDVFVALRSSQSDSTRQFTANSLAGFMLLSYTPDSATVRLLIRQPPAVYGATEYVVDWQGGDWKLRARPDGDLHSEFSAVPDVGGFVLWKV